MYQEILGGLIILLFIVKLLKRKKRKEINSSQFYFWIFFWAISIIILLSLKKIDFFVNTLGFSSSGVQMIFYIGVIILFQSFIDMRIQQERMEKNLTKIIEKLAINNK